MLYADDNSNGFSDNGGRWKYFVGVGAVLLVSAMAYSVAHSGPSTASNETPTPRKVDCSSGGLEGRTTAEGLLNAWRDGRDIRPLRWSAAGIAVCRSRGRWKNDAALPEDKRDAIHRTTCADCSP